MGSAREIDTGMEGFRFWPGALSASGQAALLAEVLAAAEQAPFYRPVTPGGRPFSVEMTGMGPLGWVSDRAGYRYQPTHPVTGAPWPPMPEALLALMERSDRLARAARRLSGQPLSGTGEDGTASGPR